MQPESVKSIPPQLIEILRNMSNHERDWLGEKKKNATTQSSFFDKECFANEKRRLEGGQNENCSCNQLDQPKKNESNSHKNKESAVTFKKETDKKPPKQKFKCIVANSSSSLVLNRCPCRKAATAASTHNKGEKTTKCCNEERLEDLEKVVKNIQCTLTSMEQLAIDAEANKRCLAAFQENLQKISQKVEKLRAKQACSQQNLRESLAEQLTDIQILCDCAEESQHNRNHRSQSRVNRHKNINVDEYDKKHRSKSVMHTDICPKRREESGKNPVSFNEMPNTSLFEQSSKIYLNNPQMSQTLQQRSSLCNYCANAVSPKSGKYVAAEIHSLTKGYRKYDILLTVVPDKPYYHMNVFSIRSGLCLGCIMATSEGFHHMDTQVLLAQCITFFVTNRSSDLTVDNVQNISAFFELIRGAERKHRQEKRHHKK